jgi:hypothetical protein
MSRTIRRTGRGVKHAAVNGAVPSAKNALIISKFDRRNRGYCEVLSRSHCGRFFPAFETLEL